MAMKNYVAFLLYLCFCFGFPIKGYAQDYGMKYSCYYDGYWGAWCDCVYYYSIYGNYGGFNFYYSSSHPSDYLFRFQINSYMPPSKYEIKKHWKSQQPFVYQGVVEYYVDQYCPTAKDALKKYPIFVSNSESAIKKISAAEIRILPYKKHPVCYNIFFDDVGFAISLGTASFPK